MSNGVLRFPVGFLWGAATSSYQIEGGLTNDWSEWEKSTRRLKDLEAHSLAPATDYQSGLAANSWEQFEKDIVCLKKINATAYRFSVEWSRIEPEEGKFNEEALARYRFFIQRLREEKIEPFVTLWHWPIPLWLRDKGGWENSEIVSHYSRYVYKVVKSLSEVTFWTTLNEHNSYVGGSYILGKWPPQKKNPLLAWRVIRHLIQAHRSGYEIIKKINPEHQVGIASLAIYFEPMSRGINSIMAAIGNWWYNRYFFNQIKNYQDYIGINYYFHNRVKYGFGKNENKVVSDMGWELYPKGLYNLSMDAKRYGKPIYITEHGLADAHDTHRAWYIQESLKYLHQAISEGADVRGYFHWSLLDNFEWVFGYTHKFGLFSFDKKTWERSARPSAEVYGEIAKTNELKY
ncbi:MAG TPA: glycoside hydrolase family 1 protein [bacterium]|nr:glycoside hydrolase family 1 protein [bacterium]